MVRKRPYPMDAAIRTMYGVTPPPKSAALSRSVDIAYDELLQRKVLRSSVMQRAANLHETPIPYSTHDLAVATALTFFKDRAHKKELSSCATPARSFVLNWALNGMVAGFLAEAFDKTLHDLYQRRSAATKQRATSNGVVKVTYQLIMLQVSSKYASIRQLLPDFETNRPAAGYVFGLHDTCFRMIGKTESSSILTEISKAYAVLFGALEGSVLFRHSVALQLDEHFQIGERAGHEDYENFIRAKIRPLGLNKILKL